jgi:SAM-dependent methyltransferase
MDSVERFSNRVESYITYRPTYPIGVIDVLREELGLQPSWTVADIGSGPGTLAVLFLRHGNTVFGVEPNRGMRASAERLLDQYPRFRSVDGTAEATTLASQSVDLVAAGQAFHWFDPNRARQEFQRILKPPGRVALVWNSRRTDATPFLRAYEALLKKYGTDYAKVTHRNVDEHVLGRFFGPRGFRRRTLYNEQTFDLEGLKGRMVSSSYVPAPGHPSYESMMREAEDLFREYQTDGAVKFEYDTEIYCGQLS